jgi:hypothetical protein
MRLKAEKSLEKLETIYLTIQGNIPEKLYNYQYRCENLKLNKKLPRIEAETSG